MINLAFRIDAVDEQKILAKYQKFRLSSKNKNVNYFFKTKYLAISIFKNNTLQLQGSFNACYSFIINFFPNKKNLIISKNQIQAIDKTNKQNISNYDSIGCDEVGVGDYFGPLVTCACYVKKEDIDYLIKIGVTDSKKICDSNIINIFNQLKKFVLYTTTICYPKKYNDYVFKNKINAHGIKTICHNSSLSNLVQKYHIDQDNSKIIIDKYVDENKYYQYLNANNVNSIKINVFETKAETKYIAVACASIIARYTFLQEIDKMSKKIKIKIPLGSSNLKQIIYVGKIINKSFNLYNFAKLHFDSITSKIVN